MRNTLTRGSIAASAFLFLTTGTPALAQEQGDDGWQVSFTPYIWVAGIDADLEVPNEGAPIVIDRNFTDVFSSLKFAFMGALNVEYGNFVMMVDGNFLSLDSESEDIEEPVHLDGEVKTKAFEATPLVGYKVINSDSADVELLAGARILSLKNDVRIELPLRVIEDERSRTSITPVVASRAKIPLGGRWGMTLYGDMGGMTGLDFTWQLLGAITYRLGDHWSLGAGYRHLAVREEKSGRELNMSLSGPLFGVTYRF